MDFYQACTLVALGAFVVLVIYAVRALIQVKHTGEAAEYLLMTTAEKVDQTKNAFDLIENVTGLLDMGWFRAMKAGMDLVKKIRREDK